MDDGRYYWHWDPNMLRTWEPGQYSNKDDEELKERLQAARKLTIPTLLIRGRLSDLVSTETAAEFLEMVPHAEYVDLAGAHHMVAGDRNDAFTGAVKGFLLKHFGDRDVTQEDRVKRSSQ
jgi:pimeloyl-ACP methyl ester carboxylesterase